MTAARTGRTSRRVLHECPSVAQQRRASFATYRFLCRRVRYFRPESTPRRDGGGALPIQERAILYPACPDFCRLPIPIPVLALP